MFKIALFISIILIVSTFANRPHHKGKKHHGKKGLFSKFAQNPNQFFKRRAFQHLLKSKKLESTLSPEEISLLKQGYHGERGFTGNVYVKPTTLGTRQISFPRPAESPLDWDLIKETKEKVFGRPKLLKAVREMTGGTVGAYMDFWPATLGIVTTRAPITVTSATCFQKMVFSLSVTNTSASYKDGTVTITVEASNPKDETCGDSLMFMTRQLSHFHDIFTHGTHHIETRRFENQADFDDIRTNGMRIFELPLGYAGTVASLYDIRKLFEKDTMYEANIEWVRQFLPWNMTARPTGHYIGIDEKLIPSGTFLAIQSPISYGTGSTIGHSVVALWKTLSNGTRQLWTCESTDICPDPGLPNPEWPGYPGTDFPPPYGQSACRPFSLWVKQAYEAGFWVNALPLKAEYQAKFNEEKAWAQVQQLDGQDYGYASFVYTFLDTLDGNWPYPVTSTLMSMALGNAERVMQDLHLSSNPKYTVKTIIIDGLNYRLTNILNSTSAHINIPMKDGFVDCQDMVCVWSAVDQLKITLPSLWTRPSSDSWLYPNLQNGERTWDSNVCDVYVCRTLKAAGVFGDLDFQCNELTPRDLSRLTIWQDDPSWKPSECNQVPGDEKHGWCQIIGYNTMYIDNYSTRDPKEDMYYYCGTNDWNGNDYKYQPPNC